MDQERLRLSNMQNGTDNVQICDKWIYRPVKGIFDLRLRPRSIYV